MTKAEELRTSLVGIIIGKRKSGKTTLMKNIINSNNKKVLIVDTFNHPSYTDIPIMGLDKLKHWKKGTYRVISKKMIGVMTEINNHLSNALIVFEDATKYLDGQLDDDVKEFIIDSKQKNLDLYFMFHGWGMVPPDLYRLLDTITMFKTRDNPISRKIYIPNFEYLYQKWNYVQNHEFPYKSVTLLLN